jgi:hypothetical protein
MTTRKRPITAEGTPGQRTLQDPPQPVKRKGGFDGERTRTEPRYQKTRDSREGLGYCSKLGTAVRYALSGCMALIGDRNAPARINGILMRVRSCDPEPNAPKQLRRGLATEAGQALLLQYNFQQKRRLDANVLAPFSVDLATGQLTMPQFTPSYGLKFPKGTSMAGLQLYFVCVDPDTFAYTVTASPVATFTPADSYCIDFALSAPLPLGRGILFAFLFSGFCDVYSKELRWSARKETALGFVGVLCE